jgi:hypothetical protein
MAARFHLSRPRLSALALACCSTLLGPGLLHPPAAHAQNDGAGAKGAQVYCFMRNNGNDHQVSWTAAYALIKRQGAGMFKTSPEHAAVLITEAVVQNPGTYPDCGRYLGDLFNRKTAAATAPVETSPASQNQARPTSAGLTRSERYNN